MSRDIDIPPGFTRVEAPPRRAHLDTETNKLLQHLHQLLGRVYNRAITRPDLLTFGLDPLMKPGALPVLIVGFGYHLNVTPVLCRHLYVRFTSVDGQKFMCRVVAYSTDRSEILCTPINDPIVLYVAAQWLRTREMNPITRITIGFASFQPKYHFDLIPNA